MAIIQPHRNVMTGRHPKEFSEEVLKEFGVEIIDKESVKLKCIKCQAVWSVNLLENGGLPRGYWRCPKRRCNA
jgi:hypothetical protein